MPDERIDFPADKLNAAIPDDPEARARIEALKRELASDRPTAANIHTHVTELRKHASLRDLVTAWFENPRTQAFIEELTAAGL
jgi:methylthioribose-1-phosphate isomerase